MNKKQSASDEVRILHETITGENLISSLSIIGWSLSHMGCNFYSLVNSCGEKTHLKIRMENKKDRIEYISTKADPSEEGEIYFDIKKCNISLIDGETLSIGVKEEKGKYCPAFFQIYGFKTKKQIKNE